ncbi:MAG: hypothetical protein JWN68_2359 [Nocardioides sp.]|jgi:DNA-binding protein YbaB|uniref:hypothetical protein n=1 Tax=Nocardioides sp. TaxID=35761 RepID=UPI00260A94EF|nr:hypothetical protein [Nocardioides sp.]MCW2834406.1 hypothetical protein [Nocardioides sp.]
MTSTATESRIQHLTGLRDSTWFTSRAECRGVDESTGVAVTADVTGWVLEIDVPEISPSLRTGEGLESALRAALSAAMDIHRLDNAAQRTLTDEERARAQDHLAGRAQVRAPRVPRPAPLTIPTSPVQAVRHHADERLSRRWQGRSRDGEIEVLMSLSAGLEEMRADPAFLTTTDAETLRYALREAFRDAETAYERGQA